MKDAIKLLNEASLLAEQINRARSNGNVPSDECTVRLCEILDILSAA